MKRLTFVIQLSLFFLLSACGKHGAPLTDETLPAEPDYADTTQWYAVDRQAAVDIFYIVST